MKKILISVVVIFVCSIVYIAFSNDLTMVYDKNGIAAWGKTVGDFDQAFSEKYLKTTKAKQEKFPFIVKVIGKIDYERYKAKYPEDRVIYYSDRGDPGMTYIFTKYPKRVKNF
jgi:hypothetical protein